MASAPSDRSRQGRALPNDLTALLPWCASLLLVLYLVGVLNSAIPLQVSTPEWQLRLCEALINQSPLVLMGLSVAIVGRHLQPDNGAVDRLLRWTQRAALPLTLGFALLIPLQGMAAAKVQGTDGGSGSTTIADPPGTSQVPGPLPLLGAGVSLGLSRRLRQRLRLAQTA